MNSIITFGWYSFNPKSHELITENAVKILQNKTNVPQDFFTKEDIATLKTFSEMPDKDEVSVLKDTHFHHHVTKRTIFFRTKTAVKLFMSHAQKALDAYKNNDKQLAIQELGRACHFLEDLAQPLHTTTSNFIEAKIKENKHSEYEKYTAQRQNSYQYKAPDKIDTGDGKDFMSFIKDLARETVEQSSKFKINLWPKDKSE